MLDILDAVTLAGSRKKPNEDAFGRCGDRAWVIDGATSLGDPIMPAATDAAWLAMRANELFARHARLADTRALIAAVADDLTTAFEQERTRAPLDRWEIPCGSFLMLTRRDAGRCEIAWLGDCRAILRDADGVVSAFGATPVSEAREAKQAASYTSQDPIARYQAPDALAMLRAGRARYNAPGGPAILAPGAAFMSHVTTVDVALKPPAAALLMTDGFAALELRYGAVAEADFVPAALADGLARLSLKLRKIEEEDDPDGGRFARWKASDDATAALVSIS